VGRGEKVILLLFPLATKQWNLSRATKQWNLSKATKQWNLLRAIKHWNLPLATTLGFSFTSLLFFIFQGQIWII
jgi:hypothetical protein